MNPRSARVLVFATALLTAPLLPALAQPPVHRPQPKPAPKSQVIVKSDTPIDPNDPNQAPQTSDPNAQAQPTTSDPNAPAQPPAAAPAAPAAPDAAPNPNAAKGLQPAQIGIAFNPPQGWQQGDPTKFTVPGNICCVWSPDNTASIAAFVQNSGKPYNPRTLLEQSADALQKSLNAQVKQKEIVTVGGMRAFSLVVTGPGTGAGIDGKGTVPTTQHWLAVPRDKDVVIFLMTTPDDKFAANEAVFQTVLSSLKVSGTQTPDQQAAK
jgi:hypothetical protein